eukprot:350255-Chlamydomonas_euryale.AAC.43
MLVLPPALAQRPQGAWSRPIHPNKLAFRRSLVCMCLAPLPSAPLNRLHVRRHFRVRPSTARPS